MSQNLYLGPCYFFMLCRNFGKQFFQIALILSFNLVYSMSLYMEKRLSNSKSRTTNLYQANHPTLPLRSSSPNWYRLDFEGRSETNQDITLHHVT